LFVEKPDIKRVDSLGVLTSEKGFFLQADMEKNFSMPEL
jgi:hypothetical protein